MAYWCGHEMTGEECAVCDKVWGGECDLATDLEIDWEERFEKSAWYWNSTDCKGSISKDYKSRPDEFSTFGYTDDFEDWGQNAVVLAVVNFGLRTEEDIYEFLEHTLKFKSGT